MVNLKALIQFLNEKLRVREITDYCPNGVQVEGKEKLQKLGFAVSASLSAIKKAKEKGCDALIVHHGLFWNRDEYPILSVKKEKIQTLFDADMSLLAYHLPLDADPEVGNNWKAASDLKWSDLEVFQMIGVKGSFEEMPINSFVKKLEGYYGHPAFTALGGKKVVKSAALISGGAWKEIEKAADSGVDCFITGNFDEPAWHIAHERKINFLALGHFATERVGIQALMHLVKNKFGLDVVFIDEPNPF